MRRLDDFSVFEVFLFLPYWYVLRSLKITTTSHSAAVALLLALDFEQAGRKRKNCLLHSAQHSTAQPTARPVHTAPQCTALLTDWLNAAIVTQFSYHWIGS